MKIYMKLPGERELCFEKEPMKPERFESACWLVGILAGMLIGAWAVIRFFELVT